MEDVGGGRKGVGQEASEEKRETVMALGAAVSIEMSGGVIGIGICLLRENESSDRAMEVGWHRWTWRRYEKKKEDMVQSELMFVEREEEALWDRTLELRFLLQKAFSSSNRLPQALIEQNPSIVQGTNGMICNFTVFLASSFESLHVAYSDMAPSSSAFHDDTVVIPVIFSWNYYYYFLSGG
ncbi:hypothetical protein COCNU_scaffold030987G000040 [Cocos nucifera]|nr:hypothetical protein [Cocos nucifera]